MRKAFYVAVLLVSCVSTTSARNLKVTVEPGGDGKATGQVADYLRGKIGATERYSLVTDASFDLFVTPTCLSFTSTSGLVCRMDIDYYPTWSAGLSHGMTGIIISGDQDYIVGELFNTFVTVTSDQRLEVAEKDMRSSVHLAASDRYIQGLNDGKAACEPPKKKPTQ